MRFIAPYLAVLPLLVLPLAVTAANDCSALQTEVETLRAKVRTLEAGLAVAPSVAAQTSAALPGTAAKPAATQIVVVEEPYSRTGCSRGLFKGIEPAKWQDPDLWLDLSKGQPAAEVEKLLGVAHYDERGGGNVIWHYGRCGAASMAQVLFTNGQLADWRAPTR